MYPKFYFFCLMIFPSLIFRMAVFHIRTPKWYATIAGMIQDAFMAWQAVALVVLIQHVIPQTFPAMFWILSFGYLCIQIDVAFDACLFSKTEMRLDVSFFPFLNHLRVFWDSIKQRGAYPFILMGLVIAGFNFFVNMYLQYHLEAFVGSQMFYWTGLFLSSGTILAQCLTPHRVNYATANTLWMQELWVLKELARGVLSAFNFSHQLLMPNKNLFFSSREDFSLLTPNYPILKMTHGFTGKKALDVRIEASEQPNVIFLFMESWRSSDVGALGGTYPITPCFDRLANEGILFRNFYANSVKTTRAVTASLFGIPSDVETIDASHLSDFPLISIADVLKRSGYQCSFQANHLDFENQRRVLKRHGFDHLIDHRDIKKAFPNARGTSWGLHDEWLMRYAADQLDSSRDTPQFLCLSTITNHHPWICPPGPHQSLLLPDFDNPDYGKYLRTFHYSDWCLGLLIDQLEEKGLLDNTILFVLGDHGQQMGEHTTPGVNHLGLFEENIHVPLLIYAKNRIMEPQITDMLSSQLDIMPTVMDLLNLKGLNHSVGSSLLRHTPGKKVFFHNPYVHSYFGCRYDHYKLIHTRRAKEVALYDLRSDPHEQHNLYSEMPELAAELLSDVRCYETFFKRLYRERLIRPSSLEDYSLELFGQS